MKTTGKHEMMTRIARQSLVFAALVAMVLSTAGISGAQSSATSPAAPAAKPPAAPAKASASPAAKPAKGSHEGITVHGHWTIEVRNPDGKLVSHSEFENALQSEGQEAIAALLWGYTPGDWEVALDGASGDTQLPCASTLTSGSAPCLIAVPGSFSASTSCAGGLPPSLASAQCFPNLTLGDDTSHSSASLSLGGTLSASAAGVITDVETFLHVCSFSSTPTACASASGAPIQIYEFTSATLPAQNSGLCGGANQPICAVNVGAQQIISVAVTLSFQ
jgi:hypothetical protein